MASCGLALQRILMDLFNSYPRMGLLAKLMLFGLASLLAGRSEEHTSELQSR